VEELTQTEWDQIQIAPLVRVELFPNRIAPILIGDHQAPTVEPEEPTAIESIGATRSEALDDACRKLRELAPS
jgi:hypothetical protein